MSKVRTSKDIYTESIRRNIVSGLHQTSKEFMQLKNNKQRVKFVYNILKKQGLLPTIISKEKCEEASISFRNLGNDYLRENRAGEALQLYNLALLHAPVGSLSMALAIGNRSAVLYFDKKYEASIRDIDCVFGMRLQHSEKFTSKLLDRYELCKEALSREDMDDDSMRNEYWNKCIKVEKTHDTIPCASSKVEIRSSQEMGRHVVACEDIQVGEIIAVEKPYAPLLLKTHYLIRCSYCMALCNNLLPCDQCCFVMYCSRACKEAAWTEYHQTECPLMATLQDLDITMDLQALRIVIKARNECGSWKMFIDKINDIESCLNTKYRGHVMTEDGKYVYDSKYFNSIHSLATNVERRSFLDLYQQSTTASLLLHALYLETKFLDTHEENFPRGRIFWMIGGLLLQHVMIVRINTLGFQPLMESNRRTYQRGPTISAATYAVRSLLNHSCASNVNFLHRRTETAVVAIRPIKKGEQIFLNYGYNHERMTVEERKKQLQTYYHFTCACVACRDDWPLLKHIKPARKLSEQQKKLISKRFTYDLSITRALLRGGDVELAIDYYPEVCKIAAALQMTYPSLEMITYMQGIIRCMAVISETVPFFYSRLYKW